MQIRTPRQPSADTSVGDLLVQAGRLAVEQLEQVRDLQAEKGGLLGPLLVQLGFVAERDLAETLAKGTGLPLAGKEEYLETVDDLPVSVDFLRQHYAVPLRLSGSAAETSSRAWRSSAARSALG